MLKRGTNAHFRYKIALPVGVNLHPRVCKFTPTRRAFPLAVGVMKKICESQFLL